MRIRFLAMVAVLGVMAYGRLPISSAPADYRLYAAGSTQGGPRISIIDSQSHNLLGQLPLGTPSSDWKHLYYVSGNTLVDFNPQAGANRHQVLLGGSYHLPPATVGGMPGGLSQNGAWLTLETAPPAYADASAESHLLVVDTSFASPPLEVSLPGSFEFDAISNDGQRLYLIQHAAASQYFVRLADVRTGHLDATVIFDKSDGSATMSGVRLSSVPASDGHWLFSVYARRDKSAFIHALSLDNPLAFCIDLPGTGYASDPRELLWSVTMSPDGQRVYATNGATGIVVAASAGANGQPAITSTGKISPGQQAAAPPADWIGANGAAVSPDGRTLAMSGDHGVAFLDTATLREEGRALVGWNVLSVVLSPDGRTLYAINDAGQIAELPMSATAVTNVFDSALGRPLELMTVEASP